MARRMERLVAREQARVAAQEERRRQASAERSGEDPSAFVASLHAALEALRADLAAVPAEASAFDDLIIRTRAWQASLTRAAPYLAAYDIQRAQRDITSMEQRVRGRKARLLPRQEFSFAPVRARQQLAARTSDVVAPSAHAPSTCDAAAAAVRRNERLQIRLGDVGSDCSVCDAEDCVVDVEGGLAALRLRRLVRCQVRCGPVGGSVFVDECADCHVMIEGAAQLRIHTTRDCRVCCFCFVCAFGAIHLLQFGVVVRSAPILEDSSGLVFYPLHGQHEGNQWREAKDFNCLGTVSANFVVRDND